MSDTPRQLSGLADTALDALADTALDTLDDHTRVALADTFRAKRATAGADAKSVDASADASTDASVGDRVIDTRGDRYQVLAEHARGGLGRVLRARDSRLDRTVAIKEMLKRSDLAESLFMREALVTARLQHPGIVSVIEAGRWPSGEPYYIMDLISGQSLQALIAKHDALEPRMALLPNVIAIVETIAYAHSQGVVHSDIKPANVIVGDFGETLVIDWGLARVRTQPATREAGSESSQDSGQDSGQTSGGTSGGTSGNTSGSVSDSTSGSTSGDTADDTLRRPKAPSLSGRVVGTPAYMAPEQARGRVDRRTDVYALGALLYELLSGEPPYRGTPLAVLDQLIAEPPQSLAQCASEVPADLVTIVEKAMNRDPDRRYGSAKELAEELRRFQGGQWVVAHRYSFVAVIRRWAERNRAAVGVALAALLVLAVLAAVSVNRIVTERDHAAAEGLRAHSAKVAVEQRQNELVLAQAASALDHDPTATVAWLRELPLTDGFFGKARELFDDAMAQGVARHAFVHDSWVADIAFNPAGSHLLSASRDGTLRLSALATGAQRVVLRGQRSVDVVAFARDGAWCASNRGDDGVLLWSVKDGVPSGEPRVLRGHDDRIVSLRFTADSARLLSHDADGVAIVWDAATGTPHSRVRVGEHFAFTSDAKRVFVAEMADGVSAIKVIDVGAHTEVGRTAVPTRPLNMSLSPDNTLLAIYGADGYMWLLDTARGRLDKVDEHRIAVMASAFPVVFSPKGRYLVAGTPARAIQVWDLHNNTYRLLHGHTDVVFDFVFSADESLLVSAGDDATVWVWDLASSNARALRGHTDDVMRVAISPAGDMVATSSKDGQVRVWTMRAGGRRLSGHVGTVSGIVSNAPEQLITTTRNGEIRRWDLTRDTSQVLAPSRDTKNIYRSFVSVHGDYIATHDNPSLTLELWSVHSDTHRFLTGHSYQIYHLAYSADGRWLASTDRGGHARLWDLAGASPKTVKQDRDVCGTALSPNGAELALLKRDTIEFWAIASQTRRASIPLPGTVQWCADITRGYAHYSPDGSHVAVVASPWGLLLRETATGTFRWLDVGSHLINAMRFSADGARLAAGVHDRTVRVWDVASGQGQILGAHRDMIMDVTFAPDAKLLASASYDHTIRLWDLDSNRKRVLRSHNASVDRLLFSADGSWLLSGSRDRTIRMWDLHAAATIPDSRALQASIAAATTVSVAKSGRVLTRASGATARD